MPLVLSKRQNYKLWHAGAWGNRLRVWPSVADWNESRFAGTVVLRYLGDTGGRWCHYNLSPTEVPAVVDQWLSEGAEWGRIMVNEAAPDQHVVLQGELFNGVDPGGQVDCFYHSWVRAHMRPALAECAHHCWGLRSRLLLQQFMSPGSYEDLMPLLVDYPDHVFELSIYTVHLGDIPRRNTLVWEVRKY